MYFKWYVKLNIYFKSYENVRHISNYMKCKMYSSIDSWHSGRWQEYHNLWTAQILCILCILIIPVHILWKGFAEINRFEYLLWLSLLPRPHPKGIYVQTWEIINVFVNQNTTDFWFDLILLIRTLLRCIFLSETLPVIVTPNH